MKKTTILLVMVMTVFMSCNTGTRERDTKSYKDESLEYREDNIADVLVYAIMLELHEDLNGVESGIHKIDEHFRRNCILDIPESIKFSDIRLLTNNALEYDVECVQKWKKIDDIIYQRAFEIAFENSDGVYRSQLIEMLENPFDKYEAMFEYNSADHSLCLQWAENPIKLGTEE